MISVPNYSFSISDDALCGLATVTIPKPVSTKKVDELIAQVRILGADLITRDWKSADSQKFRGELQFSFDLDTYRADRDIFGEALREMVKMV